jgi:hypothetical protein
MSNPNPTQSSIIQLVQNLSEAIVYTESSNFDTNRKLWNQVWKIWIIYWVKKYAKDWAKDVDWVQKMVKNLPEVNASTQEDIDKHLQFLGDEWSNTRSLQETLSDFLFPYFDQSSTVLEIGSGGGISIPMW